MRPRYSLATLLVLVLALGLALGLFSTLVSTRARMVELERLRALQASQAQRLARPATLPQAATAIATPTPETVAEVQQLRLENERLRAQLSALEAQLRVSGAAPASSPPASSPPSR